MISSIHSPSTEDYQHRTVGADISIKQSSHLFPDHEHSKGLGSLTAVEHNPVHSYLLVSRNAKLHDQLGLGTDGHQSGQELAVAAVALVDIRRLSIFDAELRVLIDILQKLGPRRWPAFDRVG